MRQLWRGTADNAGQSRGAGRCVVDLGQRYRCEDDGGVQMRKIKYIAKVILFVAALFTGILIYANLVYGQSRNCAPRQIVLDRLTGKYGETRQSVAMVDGNVVETFANIITGTWTVAITYPNGVTCLILAGKSFERINKPSGDQT